MNRPHSASARSRLPRTQPEQQSAEDKFKLLTEANEVLQVLVRTRCDTPRSDVLTPLSDDVTSASRVLSCAVIRGGFN